MVPAREVLKVVSAGEESPGVIFYGLVPRGEWISRDFPLDLWPGGGQVEYFRLHGADWEIPCWDLALSEWPLGETWKETVSATLRWICGQGSTIGWMSAEGRPFCDPPALFDPNCMSGGVLAYRTSDGTFECPFELDEPLRSVEDGVMRELRLYSGGLADAAE